MWASRIELGWVAGELQVRHRGARNDWKAAHNSSRPFDSQMHGLNGAQHRWYDVSHLRIHLYLTRAEGVLRWPYVHGQTHTTAVPQQPAQPSRIQSEMRHITLRKADNTTATSGKSSKEKE